MYICTYLPIMYTLVQHFNTMYMVHVACTYMYKLYTVCGYLIGEFLSRFALLSIS